MSNDPPREIDGEHCPLQDPFLDNLVGDWDVRGTVVGQQLRHRCDARWVLNHQFMRILFEGGSGPLHNVLSWNSRKKEWTMVIRQKNSRGIWRMFATETFVRKQP